MGANQSAASKVLHQFDASKLDHSKDKMSSSFRKQHLKLLKRGIGQKVSLPTNQLNKTKEELEYPSPKVTGGSKTNFENDNLREKNSLENNSNQLNGHESTRFTGSNTSASTPASIQQQAKSKLDSYYISELENNNNNNNHYYNNHQQQPLATSAMANRWANNQQAGSVANGDSLQKEVRDPSLLFNMSNSSIKGTPANGGNAPANRSSCQFPLQQAESSPPTSKHNNSLPFHLSRAVNNKTSNVLNNHRHPMQQRHQQHNHHQQSQQQQNNYNHDHSHNNSQVTNGVAMPSSNSINSNNNGTKQKPHHHQRASSESWSKLSHKQMNQAALLHQMNNDIFNNLNTSDSAAISQQLGIGNNLTVNLSSDLCVGQQFVQDRSYNENNLSKLYHNEYEANYNQDCDEDDLEQYYSRNLHLLDNNGEQQFANGSYNYPRDSYDSISNDYKTGHMSAPTQRRYKWPKQQYQYLNPNSIDNYQFFQSQAQFTSPPQSVGCYERDQLNYDQSCYSNLEAVATLGRRGKSSSKKRNPLIAIFQPNQHQTQTSSPIKNKHNNNNNSNNNNVGKFYSNTIHLSSSKSHQNLNNNKSSQQLGGGSLKRIKSSPLTAQQASYEAMRTIDMYLIRQIARSCMGIQSIFAANQFSSSKQSDKYDGCKDFEMEQKIDLEIRLRELAAQSLLEARNEIDVLEVEKSLLTSDQRMNCYASQLEQQRKRLSNPSLSTADSGRGSKSSAGLGAGGKLLLLNTTPDSHGSDDHESQPRATATTTTTTTAARSDVIGQPAGVPAMGSTSSPSFSSQSSPSKLSPVSGQSASSQEAASSTTGGATSAGGLSSTRNSRSRVNLRYNQHQWNVSSSNASTTTTNTTTGNTLQRRQRAARNKRREQLLQNITRLSNINCNMVSTANRATVSLSELRIPLMWRDKDHFKGQGDYKRYAAFCLLKINDEIYDTQLISDVDRQLTDLTFDDVIVFHEIEHEFELTLEIYSCVYLEQFSLSSTPRKLKEKLSSSVSRAMGRRLATQTASAQYTKELQAYDKSYRFAMIASARLRLEHASQDQVKTYDLALVSPSAHHRLSQNVASTNGSTTNGGSSNQHPMMGYQFHSPASQAVVGYTTSSLLQGAGSGPQPHQFNQRDQKNTLPLFGHFCCRLCVKPDVFDKSVKTGYLRVARLPDSNNQPRDTHTDSPDSALSTAADQLARRRSAGAPTAAAPAAATVHWALLRNFALHLWPVDEQRLELALRRGHAPQVDISRKPPFSLPIDKFARLLRVSNSSLTVETERGCYTFSVYNMPEGNRVQQQQQQDEIGHWLRPIEQLIYDSHIWGPVLNHHQQQQMRPNR